jgi:murein L,D-transpeptidase YafK
MNSNANRVEIVIHKRERTLLLYMEGRLARTYPVALGRNWAADKAVEGDEATPLGEFYICAKNPRSRYFLSVCISYPNAEDAARGLAEGLISLEEQADIADAIRLRTMPPQHTMLGGEIYIHGHGNARADKPMRDWTRGCIALEDSAMRDLYDLVGIGTPVRILE